MCIDKSYSTVFDRLCFFFIEIILVLAFLKCLFAVMFKCLFVEVVSNCPFMRNGGLIHFVRVLNKFLLALFNFSPFNYV